MFVRRDSLQSKIGQSRKSVMKTQGAYRKSGTRRPRRSLAAISEQWKSGDTKGAVKNQERAFQSFALEMIGQKPRGMRGFADVQDLFQLYKDEILALTQPPFENFVDTDANRKRWRDEMIKRRFVIAVQLGDDVVHVQEMYTYGLRITALVFHAAWLHYWSTQPSGKPPHSHWLDCDNKDREARIEHLLQRKAEQVASVIRNATTSVAESVISDTPTPARSGIPNPDGVCASAYHDNLGAPPANPDPNEPFMRDGSHLLASERGRRKIDPVTGKRMIRQMVLTPDAWPHYEWVEDVEGEFGVGPHGPECSFGMPDDPRMLSPRESWRPYLKKIGRMDLLHCFMPGPNDPDQSNPPEPYFCYPKDWHEQSK